MKMKERLLTEKEKGNNLAASILDASQKISSSDVPEEQKTQITNSVLDQLLREEEKDNKLAKSVLPRVVPSILPGAQLPTVNRVQQVSLDDYEEVRKLWTENYQTVEPPKDLSGESIERSVWIKNDIDRIN